MSKKNNDKQVATQREAQAWQFASEDRAASRAKADELSKSQGTRLKAFFDLRDKSDRFLKDIEEGKDVKGLLKGELAFRDKAGERSRKESQMISNTGARKLMGAPDANFQTLMDSQMNAERENEYARDALGLLDTRMGEAKGDLLNATTAISNDDYQIANVLSGNAAQGLGFWDTTNKNKEQVMNRPSWFSKYVMPFATAAAGGVTTWLTGGANKAAGG